jgi:acetyltransferase
MVRQDDGRSATLAVVVADDFQGQGMGEALMRRALSAGRLEGIAQILVYFLPENTRMRNLSRKLGFALTEEKGLIRGELAL